jgi:hypothetical protein
MLTATSLNPPQKFEIPSFFNGCSYGIKNCGVEVIFNGITFILNFIKIYHLNKKIIGAGTHRHRVVTSLAYICPLGKGSRYAKNVGVRYFAK